MRRTQSNDDVLAATIAAAGSVVLAGNDAVVALIAGWRDGWRRQLEWCPQDLSFSDSPRLKAYQERIRFYARQVQGLAPAMQGVA